MQRTTLLLLVVLTAFSFPSHEVSAQSTPRINLPTQALPQPGVQAPPEAVQPPQETRKEMDTKKRLEALEEALIEQRKEQLIESEKARQAKRETQAKAKAIFREKAQDPGEGIGVDEELLEEKAERAVRKRPEVLEPFGQSFFARGEELPPSQETVSAPSNYILGPGDALKIIIWSELGDETVYDVTVNPEGQVYIPVIGVMGVSGLTVGQFQETVIGSLSDKFKHFKGQVTLTKIRTLQIFITGEVYKPGALILSGLSTAFYAVYRAGGPTFKGSMRNIRVLRENKVVAEIDLYKYFLAGDKSQDVNVESGDTVFVPPIGPNVSIKGAVLRPAIYELKKEKTLGDVLSLAGGIESSAYTRRLKVFRWQSEQRRKILDIGILEGETIAAEFQVRNGDEIEVEKALEDLGNKVTVEGPVWRPGDYEVSEGMTVSGLISKAGGIVKEITTPKAGQIVRKLDQGREGILTFNLEKALAKDPAEDLALQPLDTLRVFRADEVEPDTRTVVISGAVRRPGEYVLREGMTLRDLVLRAQGFTFDAGGEGEVAHSTGSRTTEIRKVDVRKAVDNPKSPDNVLLQPLDKVNVHARGGILLEPEVIEIKGEVLRPGPYALLHREEKLSDLIKRAGGLTHRAFAEGAVFHRKVENIFSADQMEAAQRVQNELFQQATLDLKADLLRSGAKSADISVQRAFKQGSVATTEGRAKDTESQALEGQMSQYAEFDMVPRGVAAELSRIPIKLEEILKGNDREDIILRNGDQVLIPTIPGVVQVIGAVMNPSTLKFHENQSARSYIDTCGGFADFANHRRTVVLRANGEVLPLRRVTRIRRGDMILVPPKAKITQKDRYKEASQIAQIMGNLAVLFKAVK